MIEIRIHGRGGQGNIVAACLPAMAAFEDGRYAQAFPSFGAERRGAPVTAFLTLSGLLPQDALVKGLAERFKGKVLDLNVKLIETAALRVTLDAWKEDVRAARAA